MDPLSPKSASPLPHAMLSLLALSLFETEADPMLIAPLVVKMVSPSSLAVSVTAVSSVFMAHLSLFDASAVA
jgi:hypothetical protein